MGQKWQFERDMIVEELGRERERREVSRREKMVRTWIKRVVKVIVGI